MPLILGVPTAIRMAVLNCQNEEPATRRICHCDEMCSFILALTGLGSLEVARSSTSNGRETATSLTPAVSHVGVYLFRREVFRRKRTIPDI